ncbi:hypothetical protein B0H67DRAFT_596170 [Lasiosphaeris hirsuta]|uniref:Uncharacterized protein n=1 Tax=Lasiosphaeris hirsuta TaxID=260670 RepID=A0AA40B9B2_9PEZI|nr:hypothetical protein B0H67DRAFT_596170 [Lasiosphaeris hirsuta]
MASMVDMSAPPYAPAVIETISPEDFETASIRSAAPSYSEYQLPRFLVRHYAAVKLHHRTSPPPRSAPRLQESAHTTSASEAPSYHSTVHNPEPVPPYSPPARSPPTPLLSPEPIRPGSAPRQGLPPVPTGPIRRASDVPSLSQFRIPSWSTISSNPTARHYHSVALRRVTAQTTSSNMSRLEGIKRAVLDRIEEEERNRMRPLEDPYLVGEEAAARARRERLAREHVGDEVLIREDRRWDFFLGELGAGFLLRDERE